MLHPQLWNMIDIAEHKGIKTHIATNSTFINKNIDNLMVTPLSNLSISLDGLTSDTMTSYRIGSDHQETLNGIIKYLQAPKTTEVTIRFLVFKHNEHEISDVIALCRQYKVTLHLVAPILDWGYAKLPEERKHLMSSLPQFQRYDADGFVKKPQFCGHELKPLISVDGDIFPCCFDVNGAYNLGNVFEKDFYDIFWSEAYRQLRVKMNRRNLSYCKTCKHTKSPYVEIHP